MVALTCGLRKYRMLQSSRASISLALFWSIALAAPAAADDILFNRDIRPILSEHCFQCHGPDSASRQADLRLDDAEYARKILVAGQGQPSEFARRILSTDPDERMPPAESGKALSEAQKQLLVRWVESGSEFQPLWSFMAPQRPSLPRVEQVEWVRGDLDRFILHRLEKEGLKPSPQADKTTLIRRVTLDLTGLPPTPGEVADFLSDVSATAYERVIDRLLDSPRYGEHMAAGWLEAARYADTDGYQNDRYRYQHVWRDWVILAFNENKPFDEFVIEQLAGDMLPGATLKQQIATGFCRNHRINSEDGSIPAEWHVENVVDRVDTFGTVFLGLTVGCARCHDHKYDPISQKEYYQLFAYFNNVPEWGIGPNNGNSPPFIQVPKSWPNLTPQENQFVTPEPVKLRNARTEAGNGLKRPQAGADDTVMVMHELDEPRETYLLRRGQYNLPDKSERLQPGLPAAFGAVETPPGNRLELARWLVRPDNPLLARVTVNRVWQHFFGTGLVKTSENFGSQGELPSHPELLDWLAREFVDGGWDIKSLQKQILLSATYRQASRATPQLLARDPENRLVARGPRFRLPAFVLRDQALAISGLLVETQFGPPVKPYMPPRLWESISNAKYKQDHGDALYRRSLYTFWRRTIAPPTLTTLGAAEREVCTVRSDRTNTPLQALTLINNITFVEASRFLAERMLREVSDDVEQQIRHGFLLATAREPSTEELAVLGRAHASFLEQFAQDADGDIGLLKVGEKPRDEALDAARHAAMTMTASLIMNLDETLCKE